MDLDFVGLLFLFLPSLPLEVRQRQERLAGLRKLWHLLSAVCQVPSSLHATGPRQSCGT